MRELESLKSENENLKKKLSEAQTNLARWEEALRQRQQEINIFFKSTTDFVFMVHPDGRIIYLNQAASGKPVENFIGHLVYDFLSPEDGKIVAEAIERCLRTGETTEYTIQSAAVTDGRLHHYWSKVSRFTDHEGMPRLLVVARDIQTLVDEHRKTQEKEEENKLLFRELNHRVKNNLQVILSFLNLEANQKIDAAVKTVLRKVKNRISVIASLYEKFFHNPEANMKLDLAEYLSVVVHNIKETEVDFEAHIRFEVSSVRITLDSDRAVFVGLIVNELTQNFIKYVLWPQKGTLLKIGLKFENALVTLTVEDDGPGFDERLGDDSMNSDERFSGLKLVKSLVSRLDGKLGLDSKKGTKFKIEFKP